MNWELIKNIGIILGIIASIFGIWQYFQEPNTPNQIFSPTVTSNNQTGGITAGNLFVQTPPQRKFEGEIKNALVNSLPLNKDRKIMIFFTTDDVEPYNFAKEIESFLKNDGYTNVTVTRMYPPQPITGQSIFDSEEWFEIVIGTNS